MTLLLQELPNGPKIGYKMVASSCVNSGDVGTRRNPAPLLDCGVRKTAGLACSNAWS